MKQQFSLETKCKRTINITYPPVYFNKMLTLYDDAINDVQ